MPLPADYIDKLKTANPIADVMGTYVNLKRMGRDYVCLCPFHSEKTPSCYVHPDKEYFHCFGCGAGGDVITFTMRYNNLDYYEAVKLLAERGGIPLPEFSAQDNVKASARKRIYEINKTAARFFYDMLRAPEGKPCRDYLRKRGLTAETIKKYGMGFAPNSWTALKNHMLSEGYSEDELIQASLISRSQNDTRNTYDFFVYRAMFPFIDLRGNIVGFGGRALKVDDKRKYLNSKDTPAYNKNNFLFSMNFAKDVSVRSKKILLCEGNIDVISLNQAGFENAVASCGTALTPEQAKLISNYADEAVICYDSDEAGQKATKKAIRLLRECGLKVSVVTMNGAKDPDEFINKFGKAKFEFILSKAADSVSFELKKAEDESGVSNEAGKNDFMKKACDIIVGIKSPIERDIYISKLAREQGISKQAIEEQINSMLRKDFYTKHKKLQEQAAGLAAKRDPLNPDAVMHPRESRAEKQLIFYIYSNPDKCSYILSKLPADRFVTELNARIYDSLTKKIISGEDFSFSSFADEFTPQQVDRIAAIISEQRDMGIDSQVAEDCMALLLKSTEPAEDASSGDISDDDLLSMISRLRNGN